MEVKYIIDEDYVNYKEPSMLIAFPTCSFKCGERVCHNNKLAKSPNIKIDIFDLVKRYLHNPLTSAVICAGLEPFDSFVHMFAFIAELREHSNDMVVIYTGYLKDEIKLDLDLLKIHKNIIVKFGRYVPNQKPHFDEMLGVNLISENQYAERIS